METAWIVWVLTHTPQASASNGWIRAEVLHGMPIGVCRFGYEKSAPKSKSTAYRFCHTNCHFGVYLHTLLWRDPSIYTEQNGRILYIVDRCHFMGSVAVRSGSTVSFFNGTQVRNNRRSTWSWSPKFLVSCMSQNLRDPQNSRHLQKWSINVYENLWNFHQLPPLTSTTCTAHVVNPPSPPFAAVPCTEPPWKGARSRALAP